MARDDHQGRGPVQAARSAAGRFKADPPGRRAPQRGDALRRYQAAQRTLKPRGERFAHLTSAHD